MFRLFSKVIFLRVLGWNIQGSFPKLSKYIVAVVPHTSWIDFFVGLMVRSISGEQINFIGKKELFTPFLGWFFRLLGGTPIDRYGPGGSVESVVKIFRETENKQCSFERIYFSRGSDSDIYKERKKLGYLLFGQIMESVKNDLKNTVFSYIPNTAETAFYGLISSVQDYVRNKVGVKLNESNFDLIEDYLHTRMYQYNRVRILCKDYLFDYKVSVLNITNAVQVCSLLILHFP